MSIRDRLGDAELLLSQGRNDGALLGVLVAVAATSRKRYPDRMPWGDPAQDGSAFISFLLDEHPVLAPSRWIPACDDDYVRSIFPDKVLDAAGERVGGWWFKVPGSAEFGWPDEVMPLAACLYKYVRCSLAHEAGLPDNVEFTDGEAGKLTFQVLEDRLRLSRSIIDRLSRAVTFAPENFDVFRDVAEIPADVVAWMLFGKGRDDRKAYMEKRAERVALLTPGAPN